MPKTPESAAGVTSLAVKADAMLLAGNGALTLGRDLEQAYLRMELVEHYAKVLWYARPLGGARALEPAQVQKLLEARKKAGLGPP
jgi:L-fuculose-phosphate aldolase